MDNRCANSFVGRNLAGGLTGSTRHRNAGSHRNSEDTVENPGTADRWNLPLLGTGFLC